MAGSAGPTARAPIGLRRPRRVELRFSGRPVHVHADAPCVGVGADDLECGGGPIVWEQPHALSEKHGNDRQRQLNRHAAFMTEAIARILSGRPLLGGSNGAPCGAA